MAVATEKKIWEMTYEELLAELKAKAVSKEEMLRRFPDTKRMQEAARAARRELQEKGILDENGQLIPPAELPEDMRPESETEC